MQRGKPSRPGAGRGSYGVPHVGAPCIHTYMHAVVPQTGILLCQLSFPPAPGGGGWREGERRKFKKKISRVGFSHVESSDCVCRRLPPRVDDMEEQVGARYNTIAPEQYNKEETEELDCYYSYRGRRESLPRPPPSIWRLRRSTDGLCLDCSGVIP